MALHSAAGRVELNDIIASLEIGRSERATRIRCALECDFAGGIGDRHVYWRNGAIDDGADEQDEREEKRGTKIFHGVDNNHSACDGQIESFRPKQIKLRFLGASEI